MRFPPRRIRGTAGFPHPLKKRDVIASQCAHWRGNPPDTPETLGDCHVAAAGGSSQ